MVAVVKDMNAAFASRSPAPAGSPADASATNATANGELTPTLAKRLAELRRDRRMAKALGLAGGAEPPAAGPGGNYSWGSALQPWEVAAGGQRFVHEHVRVEDALLYIRWVGAVGEGAQTGRWACCAVLCAQACCTLPMSLLPPPLPPCPCPRSDLLRAYAKLQQFRVRPVAKSVCYTGDRLLEQFGTPHAGDGAAVARAYPWLCGHDDGCAAAEAAWS